MPKCNMTKAQALKEFKAMNDLKPLTPTTRRAWWNDYVDSLQKEGIISVRQADTWSNPFK